MLRRGNNEGSIYKKEITYKGNKTEYWVAQITLGYDAQGKQIKKQVTRKKRSDAAQWLDEIKHQLLHGQ